MTDVFIRVWAPDYIRLGMSIASIARWEKEDDIRLVLLICEESLHIKEWTQHECVGIPSRNFAKRSIQMAEELATGEIYAGADDDMLIYGKSFVQQGVDTLQRYPEYGLLCASPTNEGVIPGHIIEDRGRCPVCMNPGVEVIESHAVGGPGFIRKGLLTEFPPISNNEYSGFIHNHLLQKGQKSGYINPLKYLHMGSRYSISVPDQNDGYGGYI